MENVVGDVTYTAELHARTASAYMAHADYADDHERREAAAQLATVAIGHALTALAMLAVEPIEPEIAMAEGAVGLDDGS